MTYLCRGHYLLWLGPLCDFSDGVVIVDATVRSAMLLPRPGRWRKCAVHDVDLVEMPIK